MERSKPGITRAAWCSERGLARKPHIQAIEWNRKAHRRGAQRLGFGVKQTSDAAPLAGRCRLWRTSSRTGAARLGTEIGRRKPDISCEVSEDGAFT